MNNGQNGWWTIFPSLFDDNKKNTFNNGGNKGHGVNTLRVNRLTRSLLSFYVSEPLPWEPVAGWRCSPERSGSAPAALLEYLALTWHTVAVPALLLAANYRVIDVNSEQVKKYFYRPQRSWGKVIFSEACVNNSVHGGGGVRGFIQRGGGRAWFFQFFQIQWDTVNVRAVRILLECILVEFFFAFFFA